LRERRFGSETSGEKQLKRNGDDTGTGVEHFAENIRLRGRRASTLVEACFESV
jgi:hypothetical protein